MCIRDRLRNINLPGIDFGKNLYRGDSRLNEPDELIALGKNVIEDQYKILKFLES